MKLIDTHIHLYLEAFDQDRDQVIKKAIELGVDRFTSCYRQFIYRKDVGFGKKYPNRIRLMMGLHPTHVKENYLDELKHVENTYKT